MAYKSQGFASTLKPLIIPPSKTLTKKDEEDDQKIDEENPEDEVVETEDPETESETGIVTEDADSHYKRWADTNPNINFTSLEDFDFQNPDDLSTLLDTQIKFESNYATQAVGASGEKGPAQFMEETWQMAKDRGWVEEDADPTDIAASLKAQKAFMSYLYNRSFVADTEDPQERLMRTLAAYNWGEGNLEKAIREATEDTGDPNNWIEKAPPVTKNYIYNILGTASERKRTGFKSQYSWKKWGGILYY